MDGWGKHCRMGKNSLVKDRGFKKEPKRNFVDVKLNKSNKKPHQK